MPRDPAIWFVTIGGQRKGPLTRMELGLEFESGAISGEDYVWKQGMAGWVPGAKIPELATLFGAPEPPPPPPPRPAAAKPKGPALKPAASFPSAGAKPISAKAASKFRVGPEDKKKEEKGKGMMEFNTASFNINDLPAAEESEKGKGRMEFDTSHFRLSDLPAAGQAQDWSKLTVSHDVKQYKEGVSGYADAGQNPDEKPAEAAPPKKEDWSKLTVQHDVRKFKEGVSGYADSMSAAPAEVVAAPAKGATRPTPAASKPVSKPAASAAPRPTPAANRPAERAATPAANRPAAARSATPAAVRPHPRPAPAQESEGGMGMQIAMVAGAAVVLFLLLWIFL